MSEFPAQYIMQKSSPSCLSCPFVGSSAEIFFVLPLPFWPSYQCANHTSKYHELTPLFSPHTPLHSQDSFNWLVCLFIPVPLSLFSRQGGLKQEKSMCQDQQKVTAVFSPLCLALSVCTKSCC